MFWTKILRLSTLGLCLWTAACSREAPQDSPIVAMRNAWMRCVVTSFPTHVKTYGGDKILAAERAFQACQTEETAIITFLGDPEYSYRAAGLMAQHKAKLKADLVGHP